MDGSQVSFGRRGLPAKSVEPTPADPRHLHVDPGFHAAPEAVPNAIVDRSMAKLSMYVAAIWLAIFLTAGSTKHGTDLPYWMRPDADFHLRNYLFPFVFCALATLFTLGPALRRPIALKLFDDHFEFVPLIGSTRIVKWSSVGEITQSNWGKHKRIFVEVHGGRRLAITTYQLTRSRDEIASLLEYSRSHAGLRNLRVSGEAIDSRYMFPGH